MVAHYVIAMVPKCLSIVLKFGHTLKTNVYYPKISQRQSDLKNILKKKLACLRILTQISEVVIQNYLSIKISS